MINKAILMGRLTKDPELRHTDSGTPVCSFTVAIQNGYGENQKTDFINCVAWNKSAEFVDKYFTKGRMIIVEGRISTRSWEGTDGKKNYVTEVVANQVSFGESKKQSENNGDSENTDNSGYVDHNLNLDDFVDVSDTDDELPF